MNSLIFSDKIGRLIRQDAPEDLGKPTRPFLEAAVKSGNVDEARTWLDYHLTEQASIIYIYGVWNWYMVRYFLERKPSASLKDLLDASLAPWVATTAGLPAMPVAAVSTQGTSARIDVPGLNLPLVLTEGDKRYDITLGTPAEQESHLANWRASIDTAIENGNLAEFNRLLDAYIRGQSWLIHDIQADWSWALLTVIAQEWGEETLGEVLRVTEEPWVTVRYAKLRDMSAEESLQLTVEGMRGHFTGPNRAGQVHIVEESDRYVMSFDACGSGGRMRRGDTLVGSGKRTEAPYNFLMTESSYDWTWNRKGVCAYCGHCAMVNQILPIEGMGHPMRMVEYPDDPNDPCRWIIYKRPDLYPDAAFEEVGKSR